MVYLWPSRTCVSGPHCLILEPKISKGRLESKQSVSEDSNRLLGDFFFFNLGGDNLLKI